MSRPIALANGDEGIRALESTMERVGADMSSTVFLRAVSNAYHAVEAERHATLMHAFFESSGFCRAFKEALTVARDALPGPAAILDVGCGAGFEQGVLQQVFARDDVRLIVCTDISTDMLDRARKHTHGYPCRFVQGDVDDCVSLGPFDLVVTHAMVHHVADLGAFFGSVEHAVAPGGLYVMGSEPNARYWVNEECLRVLRKMKGQERRRRLIRKFIQPRRYVAKVACLLDLARSESLETRVNAILRREHGFRADLTAKEVRRLVDVHVPDDLPGDFRIGLDGFDWEQLGLGVLRNFELIWVETVGYMGTSNPADLPLRWQRVNEALAAKYPLDGSNFSALWRRRG